MKRMNVFFLLSFFCLSFLTVEAGIDGFTQVCAGSTQVYTAVLDAGLSVDRWFVSGGTISGVNNGTSVTIIWSSSASTGTLTLRKKNATRDTFSDDVTVVFYVGGTAVSSKSSVCSGSSTTLSVSGNHASISYWQISTDGGTNWSPIPSSGSNPYVYTNFTATSKFRAVSSNCASTLISSEVNVTIATPTGGGTLTGGSGFCTTYNGTISLTDYNSETIVRWWRKMGSGAWEVLGVPNKDDPTLSISVSATTSFRVETTGNCGNRFSNEIQFNQLTVPTIWTSPEESICNGATTNILIANTNQAPGTTFTWTISASNGITGASSGSGTSIVQTLTSNSPVNATVSYTITPSSMGCNGSAVVHTVTVYSNLRPGTVTGNQTICYNTVPSTPINAVGASRSNGFFNYQWQSRPPDGAWSNVGGATMESYNPGGLVSTTEYRRMVTSGCAEVAYSNVVTVTVMPGLNPTIQLIGKNSIAAGESTQLQTQAGFSQYTWKKDGSVIVGANSYSLAVTSAGSYFVIVKTTECSTLYETAAMVINTSQEANENINYIITTAYTISGITSSTNTEDLGVTDFSKNTVYFDGLGRPMQSVGYGASGNGNDLIQPITYDEFGREGKKYMSYAHTGRVGRYQAAALTDQLSFYAASSEKVAVDSHPFSQTLFEPSPLNRVTKQVAQGNAWQPVNNDPFSTNDRTIKNRFEVNQAIDSVFVFQYNTSNGFMVLADQKIYAENALYKNIVYDETNLMMIEFKDVEGRTICKKVQSSKVNEPLAFASTYYIYDDLGNLVVVIPPEGVEKLKTTLNLN